MATLLFTALGTLIGGPLGGAIGALAGRQIDTAIFAPKARQGPRLTELALSASSYGLAVPRLHGRVRVGGQVIWATDLVEHKDKQGNGKGKPATVSYSYTASLAVALSSRPIESVGRIWADGKLLRGAAGDLKVGGTMRLHPGHGDQAPDPLIAAAEGAQCPAFRGLAYVVFEDLQLGDFGNRIPALSFEVFADSGLLTLQSMIDPVIERCEAPVVMAGLDGLAVESAPADLLAGLEPLYPLDCDACGPLLTVTAESAAGPVTPLPEAAIAARPEDFGGKAGFARRRAVDRETPPTALRYYDSDRDYLPGVQRAGGPAFPGQPRSIELPATFTAGAARGLIDRAARRSGLQRQSADWRMAQLDPDVVPGALVSLPNQAGRWRVRSWEWRSDGVELGLARAMPGPAASTIPTDPGRVGGDADLPLGETRLVAYELPWDGNPATPVPLVVAATGATSARWSGASLFVDRGDGSLSPLGTTGRARATTGIVEMPPAPASPLLVDRSGWTVVALDDPSAILADASIGDLTNGANRALVGNEIMQFAHAEFLGAGRWRLAGLWRGRGGTEAAIAAHAIGEAFALLDGIGTALDPAVLGDPAAVEIAALGLADTAPATSAVHLAGIGWRPLAPVHAAFEILPDETRRLSWTRRSRGAFVWADHVDVPLNEQGEVYAVVYGDDDAPLARWETTYPELAISPAQWDVLAATAPPRLAIRQIGDRAVSLPLIVQP